MNTAETKQSQEEMKSHLKEIHEQLKKNTDLSKEQKIDLIRASINRIISKFWHL